jgi:hypothetical protein
VQAFSQPVAVVALVANQAADVAVGAFQCLCEVEPRT